VPGSLESLAVISRYQRDAEIYPQRGSVECWYRVISGAARQFSIGVDGRRQIVDLLLPGDFFGFGVRGTHAFSTEAIAADTVLARYPISRIETLAASDRDAARELSGIVIGTMARLHELLLILGRTTAEQKVCAFLLHLQERIGNGAADRLVLPLTRYDVADCLALSVGTVSRSLTALKERGLIALSGPRDIGIIDRDALAAERGVDQVQAQSAVAEPSVLRPQGCARCASSPARDVPRNRSVKVRVPPFAFGNVLGDCAGGSIIGAATPRG
jgi:CRP/FNR family nitrogen fixation transcriptional regulator